MSNEIQPGLLVLHGNRAELLGDALIEWIASHPLAPLEEEVFLVQSNGVAEWLKMSIAARRGVCAATKVELPARFLWRAYRQVLGREAVPATSGFDKLPLTWRLMQRLPALLQDPVYAPLAGFLEAGGGDMSRRLQLAERLADLYDQYQVYRGDWLQHWAEGQDDLPSPHGPAVALPPVSGRLVFDHVGFHYTPEKAVLEDINLVIEPGEVVAFVGPTGAGKSTLADLIPRFYDPTSGRVCVDGQDLREVQLESLRRQIGIVPQDTLLFSGTIRSNIAYGKPDATPAEIEAIYYLQQQLVEQAVTQ